MEMKGFGFINMSSVFVIFLVCVCGCGLAEARECTNAVYASKNETLKNMVLSHYHLTPSDDSARLKLHPRKMLREEDGYEWSVMYRKMKTSGGGPGAPGGLLKEVSLHDVRLDPTSQHGKAQQTNLEYLLMLDSDNLLWNFRKTAGLETPGEPYDAKSSWEASTSELRGHFVGHYLSASAMMWASTHNDTLKEKMSGIVSSLSLCQKEIGSGYLSAFPTEEFDRVEAHTPVWVPYYTIHKILAGLLDQYTLAGSDQAFSMIKWMVEYFYKRVQNVISKYSIAKHYLSLDAEPGGMNDILYKLYAITGDTKHLLLAHLFDKPCFLGLLAVQANDISYFHANTHIAIVIGAQKRYEVTGDPLYKEMGIFFMDIVNSSHSYATGGTSVNEHWQEPKRLGTYLGSDNEESCSTYNMLKVSRHLFRWTKEPPYADYYERALTNGVLGIQRGTEPGVMIYFLPLGRGQSKSVSSFGWGSPFGHFWCCYGTGIESFSKLGDSIYFEEEGETPGLYIIQYISSLLDWKSGQVVLNQTVGNINSWDPYLRITLTFSSTKGTGKSSTVNLRMPIWTDSDGAKAALNGRNLHPSSPGSFLLIPNKWSHGDTVTLELPISLRTEAIKDDRAEYASVQAILYGPVLLAAHTSGNWDIQTKSTNLSDWITPLPSSYNNYLVSFSQEFENSTFALANLNQSIELDNFPDVGTVAAIHATFRLILDDLSTKDFKAHDAIGKSVMLELFDLPGKVLGHQEKDKNLVIADSSSSKENIVFRLVPGLDGKSASVSLESESDKGCFVYSSELEVNAALKLGCSSKSSNDGFKQAASFVMKSGISQYHPISFVAQGKHRNFLLQPLSSFMDETYTVYLNITTV
ncbi:putative alpha-L-arabinofuranosidase B, arabinose-binding domain, six-hairpin glycosidase [Rosa chinensis]|uniref:Putative alpha-L-arabinofuranosidase B, arabinose-binding domain, six-hairpin glycosidase n=1 Tax=Rosa chinensis TaxID=74649 RepID=A0A2P6QLX6_ROSCH|nr:uncharacterized protein LOC112164289 [Rosa chinensis]PRQ35190.1 putative alpha-L-arabinofuranosidase B, arabinose-binding domain, six-hairpin glycosidase [Rosa chinensis]